MKKIYIVIVLIFISINSGLAKNINTIYVVDARKMNLSDKLTMVSLQGIVNKKSGDSAVFVILRGDDVKWLKDIENRRPVNIVKLDKNKMLDKYKNNITGQIVYDADASYTINIATTLAGIKDAVITSEVNPGLPVVFDCRNRWKNKVDAYNWAVKNLLSKTSMNMSAILEEHIISLRDFIIQNKVFVFDLDPINNEKEINLIEKILSVYKPSTPIIGWPDAKYADAEKGQNNVSVEIAFVKLISPRNIFLVASDFACNLSIYKKLSSEIPFVQVRKKKTYDPNKVYLTFVYSDGDNIQYVLNHMRSTLWDDPGRSKLPIGWTIAPLLYDWGSFILEKYYTDAYLSGNDELVMGPSGFGYVHPTHYKDMETFLRLTKEYGDKLDLTSVAIIDEGSKNEMLETYKDFADETLLNTVFLVGDYGVRTLLKSKDSSIFVLSEDFRANFEEQNIATIRNLVHSGRKMIYSYAHAWDIKPSQLYKIIKGVSDLNIEVVAPSTFSDLLFQRIVYNNKNRNNNNDGFFEAEKRIIYSVKGSWKKIKNINFFKVKCKLPANRIFSAEVVYWFGNNSEDKYFQYLKNKSNNTFSALLPPVYKDKVLHYYISVVTRDMNIKRSKCYSTKVFFYKDSDNDGLSDDFERIITKTLVDNKDSDNDGLNDGIDFKPLKKISNKKEVLYINVTDEEKYLWKDYKSLKSGDGHRYADNDAYFIYRIPLKALGDELEVGLLLDNNYVVSASSDGTHFQVIFKSPYDCHDSGNRGWQYWKIPGSYKNAGYLYLKISDGSPADGWGGGVFGIKFFANWGDVKILDIDVSKNCLLNEKNILKVSVANIYPLKKYTAVMYNTGNTNEKYRINIKYNKRSQTLYGQIYSEKIGIYRLRVFVEDEKGNTDTGETIVEVKGKSTGAKNYNIINSVKIVGKKEIEFAGWDEGDCGSEKEKRYLYKNGHSDIDGQKHRYADGNNFFIYKFISPTGIGILRLKIGNNFVVSVSTNAKEWTEILNSFKIFGKDIHDMSNYKEQIIDISKYLRKGKPVFIKISDGSPADGWGGNVGYIKFGTPPVFKHGKKVLIEIESDKKADVFVDYSSISKKDNIVYAVKGVDFFARELVSSERSRYVLFSIPAKIKNGIYKIKIKGEIKELGVKETRYVYIGVYDNDFIVDRAAAPAEKQNKAKDNIIKYLKDYFRNFGKVSHSDDSIVSEEFIAANKLEQYIAGWGEGNSGSADELKYLLFKSGTINPQGMRFADGTVSLLYHFKLPKRKRLAVAKITVGNNFIIDIYNYNLQKWETLCSSESLYGSDIHDMSNYKPYYFNITKYIKNTDELKFRFRDGSVNDGWGPCVGNIEIYIK